ncbi:ribonuclease HII [Microbacterium excoecariae]|uniref:ribonuclease HII n=1 Tax=Microbacterium excoecariae TaxID=2715210 RepID=UPI00140E6A23|nr:ribonuclease HII [Microbacterium excoecariae]NHI16824.1 ribonuclease HII [Microbacterium excoecariae]
MTPVQPTLDLERGLLEDAPLVFGLDEVGRGALAGPVTVGASVLDRDRAALGVPAGLRDSKLVAERRRADVARAAGEWAVATRLGWATPGEVDERGIMGALALAATRALERLAEDGFDPASGIVLLDGDRDYVTLAARPRLGRLDVRAVVKGDRDRAVISAASIAAKVERDALMVALDADHAPYGWARNKGYASAAHRAAIDAHGLTDHHRRSWAIGPGLF